jgi:hypothetical protein
MQKFSVYLENGFDHDHVTLVVDDRLLAEQSDLSTRYQIGLAHKVDITVPDAGPNVLRVGLPDRGRTAEVTLDAASGRHIRVNLVGDEPVIDVDPDPPRFA